MLEWNQIREKDRPKTILVTINGREKEIAPMTSEEDANHTYIQKESKVLTKYTTGLDDECEREQLHPKNEIHHNLVIRRSFHTTPRVKKSDQRENIFQTKCRVKDKVCDLIIYGGSVTNCVSQGLV